MRSALLRKLAWALAAAAVVAALAAADLVLRARSACLEGEKFMRWHEHPEEKKAFFEARFAREKALLDAEKASGRMPEAEFERRVELERFRADEEAAESSLKYAYHWFKTGAELFSPPESRWTKRCRSRMSEALALWKKELDARKVPYEPAMFE